MRNVESFTVCSLAGVNQELEKRGLSADDVISIIHHEGVSIPEICRSYPGEYEVLFRGVDTP